ncbi:MAG: helix-turn-helix transcriptional regulator [Patescibacteria group bacterium]|nr:helix-turn-helix transcriptional regulator [Patescibacteria group bacterium]
MKKTVEKGSSKTKKPARQNRAQTSAKVKGRSAHGEPNIYKRPAWVHGGEEVLCADCFKVVGDRSRYKLVCMLGKIEDGMSVGALTEKLKLQQPTVTHHLTVLKSVNAVHVKDKGRSRIYRLNRNAHCFEECKIPY